MPLPRWLEIFVVPLVNLALALLVVALVFAAIGEDPFRALAVMAQGAFVYPGSLGYTLYYTTNFIFTGLAVAVAFHAMLFNIGGEGQATLGGLGVALVCLALDPFLPGVLVILLAIGGAAAVRGRLGVHPRLAPGPPRQPYRDHHHHVQLHRRGTPGLAALGHADDVGAGLARRPGASTRPRGFRSSTTSCARSGWRPSARRSTSPSSSRWRPAAGSGC